jgi:hypothetical protein
MSTIPADMGRIAGPLLLGSLLQWGLFGALCVQVYIYYLAFANDPLQRKILVYGVYAAELVQTILFTKMAFKQLAAGFGNLQTLDEMGLVWFAVPILSSSVEFVVQVFYAYRIRILAKSNLIPLVVVLFALIQLGGAIGQGIIAHQITLFSKFLVKKTLILTGIWNAGSAVCDIIIAASMTYYLSQWRTDSKPTQQLVHRLIHLVIETGILTATVAIINLSLFLIPGHPAYWETSIAILGKMYSNTMMVVLNNRIVFKSQDDSITSNQSSAPSHSGISRGLAFNVPQGGISVTHEQWEIPLDVYKMPSTTKGLDADVNIMYSASEV